MKKIWLFGAMILMLSASPVLAGDCHEELDHFLRQELDTKNMSQDQVIQLENLLGEAQDQCSAGNEEEAQRLLAQLRQQFSKN